MGLSIPAGGGIEDGLLLLAHLARHPGTAQRIARKLCQRFVAEPPPATCTGAAAQRFRDSDGDLREVLRTILLSDDFLSARHRRSRVKRPLQHLASVARVVGVADEVAFVESAIPQLRNMGEDPYGAPSPAGWPDSSLAWVGEGTLLRRFELAARAADGKVGFALPAASATPSTEQLLTETTARYLPGGLSSTTRQALLTYLEGVPAAARAQQAAAAVLASPEFLQH
jgi:uncharacterized protein (DUF1800 family)